VTGWLRLPLVPVMRNVNVPRAVPVVVRTASVEVPDVVTVAGVNVAVAPLGSPVTDNATGDRRGGHDLSR
jgi:hypothetical protein